MIEIALYQPDIAPNAATVARLCACFGMKLTIIEPAGFVATDSAWRRAGMDYLDRLELVRAPSWEVFRAENQERRLILMSTKAALPHVKFHFESDDILLFGRESAGVPQIVHEAASHRVVIPMKPGLRSLNVAMAASLITGEALRQTGQFHMPGQFAT
jgi:tRNA (cytidine/uridine-2'-O-)-methyltransferase